MSHNAQADILYQYLINNVPDIVEKLNINMLSIVRPSLLTKLLKVVFARIQFDDKYKNISYQIRRRVENLSRTLHIHRLIFTEDMENYMHIEFNRELPIATEIQQIQREIPYTPDEIGDYNTWEEPYIGGSIKTKTKNNWLEHVKQYQKEHNITYRQALSDAKETYIKGGSLESDKVRKMYYAKNFNPLKVHNASQNILSRINKDDAKKHYENKLNITKNELTNIYRDIENIIRRYGITEQIEHTNFATGKKSNTFKYNYMDGIKGITHGKKENMEFYERPRIKNIQKEIKTHWKIY